MKAWGKSSIEIWNHQLNSWGKLQSINAELLYLKWDGPWKHSDLFPAAPTSPLPLAHPSPLPSPSVDIPSPATARKGPWLWHTAAPHPARPPHPEWSGCMWKVLNKPPESANVWGFLEYTPNSGNLQPPPLSSAWGQDWPLPGQPCCNDSGAESYVSPQILYWKVLWDTSSYSMENIHSIPLSVSYKSLTDWKPNTNYIRLQSGKKVTLPIFLQSLYSRSKENLRPLWLSSFGFDDHLIWADTPACMRAKSLQSCLTLCNPMDPGSFDNGILQARILERVAMPSSQGSSWPWDWTCVSHIYLHWQVGYHQRHPGSPDITALPTKKGSAK